MACQNNSPTIAWIQKSQQCTRQLKYSHTNAEKPVRAHKRDAVLTARLRTAKIFFARERGQM